MAVSHPLDRFVRPNSFPFGQDGTARPSPIEKLEYPHRCQWFFWVSEELIDELSVSHDTGHPVYRHPVHLFRQKVGPIDGDIGLVSEDIACAMEMQSSDRFFDYLIMCLAVEQGSWFLAEYDPPWRLDPNVTQGASDFFLSRGLCSNVWVV